MAQDARCPYCLDILLGEAKVVRCSLCSTPLHAECFEENGGCVAFGCKGALSADVGKSILIRLTLDLGLWKKVPFGAGDAYAQVRPTTPPAGPGSVTAETVGLRLSVAREQLVEGQALRGTLMVHTPTPLAVRRLELRVRERLEEAGQRATLLGSPKRGLRSLVGAVFGRDTIRIEPGSWAYELDVPGLFGAVLPPKKEALALVDAVLERPGEHGVESNLLRLELVPSSTARSDAEPDAPAPFVPDEAGVWRRSPLGLEPLIPPFLPAPARALDDAEPAPTLRQLEPPRHDPGGDDDELIVPVGRAPRSTPPPPPSPVGPPAERHRPTPRPPAPPEPRSDDAPLVVVKRAEPPAPPSGGLKIVVRPRAGPSDWTLVPLRGQDGRPGGRVLRLRAAGGASDRPPGLLALRGPERVPADAPALELVLAGPRSQAALPPLGLVVRSHVEDAAGVAVAAEGFPLIENAPVTGRGGLGAAAPPIELVLPLDRDVLDRARRAAGAGGVLVATIEVAGEGVAAGWTGRVELGG